MNILNNMDQTLHTTASSSTTTTAEDSDNDEVIDFLNFNTNSNTLSTTTNKTTIHVNDENYDNCIPILNSPTSTIIKLNNNSRTGYTNRSGQMIPTINVTPHSPAAANKYNNLFEDTLNQLQSIRESIVQMKNASVHMSDASLYNATVLSNSLPDLTHVNNGTLVGATATADAAVSAAYLIWSPQQQQYFLNTDRRKSWTAAEDLVAACCDSTNKSVSLSSLDSEEQDTIRAADQRRRNARNSTGGISTHSLNEAELARDFERIAAKRLAAESINRIPLQKSISTSSIVAKDEIKTKGRPLTDSEDENQSLLRAHTKIEVYDNVEKRRKRSSLFFRKKKDKIKLKMLNSAAADQTLHNNYTNNSNVNCEVCGATICSGSSLKEHQLECAKVKKFISVQKMNFITGNNSVKKSSNDMGVDYYDGSSSVTDYNADEAPLIRAEFLNDPPIEAHDLGADPLLGIILEEHDSWSPSVPKELLKTLKEKQIKRQEHIYEFIMTEKHHCQTLLVMQKIFVESLQRHFSSLNVNAMFPRLSELTVLHMAFLRQLRQQQRANVVVDSIADILLDFFSAQKAQQLRISYGEFCANHRAALEQFKSCMTSRDQRFAQWYKHCLTNPLLKKKGIPECILFVTQRLTKYPLLIEPLLKSARDNVEEANKLQQALNLVKALLVDVDACVAEKELSERQTELVQRIDAKSFTIFRHKPFRKCDVAIESRRRLKFEGLATLLQGRSKMQPVLVVVFTDCLCFLVENSAHNKYTFFTPEHKAGVVPLQKLLIREKAGTESRGIYIISSNPDFPEMYELKVQQPKDKQVWIQSIRQAVLECPATAVEENEQELAVQQTGSCEQRREIVEQLRQKDIEHALLLEEKLQLLLKLCSKVPQVRKQQQEEQDDALAAQLLTVFSNVSYKDQVNSQTDTAALWCRVQLLVQEITQLSSMVYQSATGLPVNRVYNDKPTADNYASPTLPKRAETFAGFDERRGKHIFPAAKLGTMQQKLTPRLQELEEKYETCKTPQNIEQSEVAKDENYVILQITHNLQALLCIITQQMTTIQQLQLQLAFNREQSRERAVYTHNDQLEELRNLQDKLQEEKTVWARQREQQQQELEEKRLAHLQVQEQIKIEQEDIKQQREQLYRKMELLSSQGLLISPNTMIVSPVLNTPSNNSSSSNEAQVHEIDAGTALTPNSTSGERLRKDKWRTSSVSCKTPPVNLLSATNAPKSSQQTVKQKIPIKLSSLSNIGNVSKIDKSSSFSASNNNNNSAGVTQLFPLKLADKKSNSTTSNSGSFTTQVQHARTGSSPAIIQQYPTATSTNYVNSKSNNVTRTDSMIYYGAGVSKPQMLTNSRVQKEETNGKTTITIKAKANVRNINKTDEEEIYF